jgi:ribonuclease R
MTKDDGEQTFGSFKDMFRSKGEDVPEEKPADDKGWKLETEDDRDAEALAEKLGGRGATPRERIDSRPPGFGAMDTGPPAYADPDSEEMELVSSFRVRTVFPDDVLAETSKLPLDPTEEDITGRMDLRDQTIFTIDGADAKDYDDAIHIRRHEDGGVEFGVHIADVSHYVVRGTSLNEESLARATSVYLPDQVIPMLPEVISNHLCSLVADKNRLAFSVLMHFDDDGNRLNYSVHKTVICSKKRCTYKGVQELLDGEDTAEAKELEFLRESLELFATWTRKQQQKRDAKGALRLNTKERKFVFGPDHEVEKVIDAPRYFSQTLIEETALAANQAVGDYFRQRGLPTIYRVHPEKDPEEIESVARSLEEHGIRVPKKDRLTGRDISRLIQAARRKPNAVALIQRIMGLIERAVYEVHDHEDVATHFGLAREAYLHFTSPIRRYPDLVVHRWLHRISSGEAGAETELKTEEFLEDLNEVAAHASMRADLAQMAERALGDLKTCQYMDPHRGEALEAQVIRVMSAGMEVHLNDYNVSAFLPTRAIGNRGSVKGPTLTIQVGRGHRSFTEGYPISVVLKDVDFLRLQLILELG